MILPQALGFDLEAFVNKELSDATKYDNREPLDESGVYSLYLLAAKIYAAGWDDGERAQRERDSGRRAREREGRK